MNGARIELTAEEIEVLFLALAALEAADSRFGVDSRSKDISAIREKLAAARKA